ncbi:MAG: MdtA/MuxA family multidrug efflux RND transporter periplasmic adaptor subunit [Proteobacteria bacterium]|nr:MdtA/MuxA family multidrug efflux RND transporter periplasmic adaptor subunit [Pseudomonadota bacterium]
MNGFGSNDDEGRATSVKEKQPFYRNRRVQLIALTVVALLVIIFIWRYLVVSARNHHKVPAQKVEFSVARRADVPVYLSGLGSVVPTYTVTVRTQVNGQLLQVLFREGQKVKRGELLAEIDPRPYEAQLLEYQGQLERDLALLANARLDLERYTKLWSQDSVSKQVLDTQAALVKQYEGTVKLDEGLIQSTQVNLIYCKITSPVDGRIGLRLVDPGNFVQTTDTNGIAVVNTLEPITVIFTIAEDNIPEVLTQIDAGNTLVVKAFDRDQNKLLATGQLLTIDNQIDPTTGTVKLRALFSNTDSHLFPNQFVNASLLIKTLKNATVVPTAAIQHGSQGDFVFVINPDSTVTVKPVVVDVTTDGQTVITSGIFSGQSVVVEGADRLTEGTKVILADHQQIMPLAQNASDHQKRVTE